MNKITTHITNMYSNGQSTCAYLLCLSFFIVSLSTSKAWSLNTTPTLPYSVITSSHHNNHLPENTLDYLANTRWLAHGDNEWIEYDLLKSHWIEAAHIAFYKGSVRDAYIDIDVSENGEEWEQAWSGVQPQKTEDFQSLTFNTIYHARYVRITGHGNSIDDANSLTGVYFSFDANPPDTNIITANASSHDGNDPMNTLDGDLSTRWSSQGSGQWIEVDLGTDTYFSSLQLAFFNGDQRQAMFDIQVRDSLVEPWQTTLINGLSSGDTNALETFYFDNVVLARYVRVIGYGNTFNTWNSITEIAPEPISGF